VDISYLDMKFNAVKSSVIHTGSCFNCPSFSFLVIVIDLKYLSIPQYMVTLGLWKVSFIPLSVYGGYMNSCRIKEKPVGGRRGVAP